MDRNILGKGWAFPIGVDARGSIKMTRYEASIEEAIRVILSTTPGERLMRPDFGCAINELVFSPNTAQSIALAEHYVREAITRWEPRVILKSVRGLQDTDNSALAHIHIEYEVRSVNTFFNMVYPFYLERGEQDSNTISGSDRQSMLRY
jgi:phage baseplate assembly protein W